MKTINYFRLIKTLAVLVMISQLSVACAVRLKPAYITGLNFAKTPPSPPITAVPLLSSENEVRLTLDSVLFETNKATLLPEGQRKVEEFAGIIQQYGSRPIIIEGHTDNRGDKKYNQRLSERRAQTVREVLIAKGISSDKLIAKGFGESNPVATNATKAGRQQNRRVEIVISNE